jgi:hypothetical protein
MAFKVYGSLDGAAQVAYLDKFLMVASEAGTVGEMCIVNATGRLTKAGVADKPQYLLLKTTVGGTQVSTDAVPIRQDMLFIADMPSGASISSWYPGQKYQIDTTGLCLDTLQTNKIFEVVSIDTDKRKLIVKLAI